ncbi:MAG TPA: hypothetical protein PLM56_06860 [Cyclobacteriaceae bacterium]|jgi:hypothetical protein|nr:hypothetical protein [Cytophagales bacterium]HMR56739.1 hypothetical protein [Cyclobacteriaceae bacterium]HRE67026.1 hypothetical protein [Cyclobacteriaceae bacterium]HRF33200.1 hypothetical protein [Cyclobacteriaceae bacterium]
MDVKELDKAIQEIAKRRNALSKIDYSNPKYDDLEEELHDLEDSLQVKYGEYLEEVLQDVHDKYCPDTDVLYPIAYLAKTYTINDKDEFGVTNKEGVFVEIDSIPGKDTKLVIVPNPMRVILNVGVSQQQIVWTAK